MYLPKLLAVFGIKLRQTKILENKDNRSKSMRHDKSERFKSEKLEKSRASTEKNISKFLGDPPSEQIFCRNVPLGAPVTLKP